MRARIPAEGRRLDDRAHTDRPWRIHDLASDFRLEDVWLLPGRGGPDDFPRLVELLAAMDPAQASGPSKLLWAIRWKVGDVLGWDDEEDGTGGRVASLAERLPEDLRAARAGAPAFADLPFTPLYLTDDEFAAEIANRTMHGVLHLGRIEDGDGIRVQMAVLVKTDGRLGDLYMLAIRPFRHLIVYPAMFRAGLRRWEAA